jgi:NodT family efflux transporter outer membrane factor (OMF) lipoprotein
MKTETASLRDKASRHTRLGSRSTAMVLICALLLSGCTVGPKYRKPTVQTPPAYKELTPEQMKDTEGWKTAEPQDDVIHGKWWEVYRDPKLNDLEERVNISNQSIAAATASFFAASALVREARSQLFPTVTTSPSITRSLQSSSLKGFSSTTSGAAISASTASSNSQFMNYTLPFNASWEPDLWGRIRNTIKSNAYAAQASAADLEFTRLSVQSALAIDYFDLRVEDSLKQLFDATVKAYEESLNLTQALYETGIDSQESVSQAATILDSTRALDTGVGIARAQYEHAIALLVGQPASTFSIPQEPLDASPPAIPLGLPSQLLERRPDVAASERLVAQANAQIGIAKAAYFPTVTLSGTAGFESSTLAQWFAWPSRYFSVGPSVAETIFDGGLRRATVQQYQAMYNQTVATYRLTVLTAFQQVEDNLAALRLLSQEIQQQDTAVKSAEQTLVLATDRYRLGIDPYLNVITAQTSLLSNQQTAVTLRMQQMTASVQLIEALGGGWDSSQMPSPKELGSKTP